MDYTLNVTSVTADQLFWVEFPIYKILKTPKGMFPSSSREQL